MKLIDLLVQELPKRGGWPDGVGRISMHANGCIFLDGKVAAKKFKLPRCSDGWSGKLPFEYTNEVTRDQYEAASAAAQQPVWDGEGLPPVGCECEVAQQGQIIWDTFKVIAVQSGTVFGFFNNGVSGAALTEDCWSFRPIRSEREETIHQIASLMGRGTFYEDASNIYDAIKSGDIKLSD